MSADTASVLPDPPQIKIMTRDRIRPGGTTSKTGPYRSPLAQCNGSGTDKDYGSGPDPIIKRFIGPVHEVGLYIRGEGGGGNFVTENK